MLRGNHAVSAPGKEGRALKAPVLVPSLCLVAPLGNGRVRGIDRSSLRDISSFLLAIRDV
jgi:hypothetical protein